MPKTEYFIRKGGLFTLQFWRSRAWYGITVIGVHKRRRNYLMRQKVRMTRKGSGLFLYNKLLVRTNENLMRTILVPSKDSTASDFPPGSTS